MVLAGNKAKHLSLVNHTTKTIHHHHHHHHHHPQQKHKTGAEVSDNKHEEENTKDYVGSNNENFHNQCSSQYIPKSNGKQLVDGLIDFL